MHALALVSDNNYLNESFSQKVIISFLLLIKEHNPKKVSLSSILVLKDILFFSKKYFIYLKDFSKIIIPN